MKNEASDSRGRAHWESVYTSKQAHEFSWYQPEPTLSLRMIRNAGTASGEPIIDAGGGASLLAGRLLEHGYQDITVLDISTASINKSRESLGTQAAKIHWLTTDIAGFKPQRPYALWHDRALFHFMNTESGRYGYIQTLKRSLRPGGQVIIATFSVDGPKRCSGLDIVQYNAERMTETLGPDFDLVEEQQDSHRTPAGSEQLFSYFRFKYG